MNGILTQLRDLVPIRPLNHTEAMRIAERQATELLQHANITRPPTPAHIITTTPKVQVESMKPCPVSGATQWSQGRWLVIINAAHPIGRQRFTLAHEFKHILDHPFVHVLYPRSRTATSRQRAEAICDYFAACLLMPRPWLVSRQSRNQQNAITSLARQFDVSQQAMRFRLHTLGLIRPLPRCIRTSQRA